MVIPSKEKNMPVKESVCEDKLLTINEVVEILKVAHSAVYSYIASGRLKAHRLGATGGRSKHSRSPWRVWNSDLLKFIEEGEYVTAKKSR